MSRSLIRGKIHSCLCYDERRENSPIIKIIDEFNMKKNNLVKSICNGVFKIAYCIWFFKMFYVISPIFTIITHFACAHFTISPQILHNETTIIVIKSQNKESLCDSLRAHVGTQVHLHLHMGRILAECFYFIGNAISYKVKNHILY